MYFVILVIDIHEVQNDIPAYICLEEILEWYSTGLPS